MNRRLVLGALAPRVRTARRCQRSLPRACKLPRFASATLPNGAVVALVEKRDTPLLSLNATVRGGALGDAPGRDGTASLFADLIQKGAGTRDAAQFAEAIENVGGSLSAGAGSEALTIRASTSWRATPT